jgi:hypothetical protein
VLRAVIVGDAAVIESLRRFDQGVFFHDGQLHFTLPGLFGFTVQRLGAELPDGDIAQHRDYRAFRRLLYGQPTNAVLRASGGGVEIADAQRDHASSVYKLTRADNVG